MSVSELLDVCLIAMVINVDKQDEKEFYQNKALY